MGVLPCVFAMLGRSTMHDHLGALYQRWTLKKVFRGNHMGWTWGRTVIWFDLMERKQWTRIEFDTASVWDKLYQQKKTKKRIRTLHVKAKWKSYKLISNVQVEKGESRVYFTSASLSSLCFTRPTFTTPQHLAKARDVSLQLLYLITKISSYLTFFIYVLRIPESIPFDSSPYSTLSLIHSDNMKAYLKVYKPHRHFYLHHYMLLQTPTWLGHFLSNPHGFLMRKGCTTATFNFNGQEKGAMLLSVRAISKLASSCSSRSKKMTFLHNRPRD